VSLKEFVGLGSLMFLVLTVINPNNPCSW